LYSSGNQLTHHGLLTKARQLSELHFGGLITKSALEDKQMAVLRDKPYPGMNFLVDVGTGNTEGPEAGLTEVVFPEARLQVTEYRNGNEKENAPRKLQTITKYGNLVLKRGVIGSLNWYQWWNDVRNGDTATRTLVIHLVNEDRSDVVLTWKFLRARPVNYQFSPLNALGAEPFIESLEVAFERLDME
jgi:phage tail-like protein